MPINMHVAISMTWMYLLLSVYVGDKSAAIDFYSKAVTELENGISCTVNLKG